MKKISNLMNIDLIKFLCSSHFDSTYRIWPKGTVYLHRVNTSPPLFLPP